MSVRNSLHINPSLYYVSLTLQSRVFRHVLTQSSPLSTSQRGSSSYLPKRVNSPKLAPVLLLKFSSWTHHSAQYSTACYAMSGFAHLLDGEADSFVRAKEEKAAREAKESMTSKEMHFLRTGFLHTGPLSKILECARKSVALSTSAQMSHAPARTSAFTE